MNDRSPNEALRSPRLPTAQFDEFPWLDAMARADSNMANFLGAEGLSISDSGLSISPRIGLDQTAGREPARHLCLCELVAANQ